MPITTQNFQEVVVIDSITIAFISTAWQWIEHQLFTWIGFFLVMSRAPFQRGEIFGESLSSI